MIKFRAWDRKNKVMRDVKGLIWEETNLIARCLPRGHEFNEWFTVALDGSEYQLMQSTGLKDKNGVEIFEGDILNFIEVTNEGLKEYVTDVKWEDCSFVVKSGGKDYDTFLAAWAGNPATTYPLFETEVIGNIHANPELLS